MWLLLHMQLVLSCLQRQCLSCTATSANSLLYGLTKGHKDYLHRSTPQKAEGCDNRIFLISEVSCILIPFASPRQGKKKKKDWHFTG